MDLSARNLGIVFAVFGSVALVACAAEVATDGTGDTDAGDESVVPSGPATVYDSGPAANPYGDAGGLPQTDGAVAKPDGAPPVNTSCTAASDCPGANQHDTVKCTSNKCDLSCQGEFYDVNGLPTDGCETADSPIDVHTQAKAVDLGSAGCTDGSSTQNIPGRILSDARVHETPAIDGFNKTGTATDSPVGAAADWYKIQGTGSGICQNDANFDLQMNSQSTDVKQKNCYRLTLLTTRNSGQNVVQACATDDKGHCSIGNGSGSYDNDSEIYLAVEKLLDPSNGCPAGVNDDAEYNVSGHL